MMFRRYAFLLFVLIVLLLVLRSAFQANGLWLALKPALVPIVSLYLDTFNSPATALALCLLMILLAVALFTFYYRRRIAPTLRDLTVLCSQLRTIDPKLGNPGATAQVNVAMERYARFRDAWHLYRATFRTENGKAVSSYLPSRYFNTQMLERQGMRLRFFLGLPNDFVGLGLVFTFLGLVAGLYFASKSMMSADISQARLALTQLLHAATFKFLTSIVGISISLVMSASQRVIVERIQSGLADLQFLLEERLSAPTAVQSEAAGETTGDVPPAVAENPEARPLAMQVGHG